MKKRIDTRGRAMLAFAPGILLLGTTFVSSQSPVPQEREDSVPIQVQVGSRGYTAVQEVALHNRDLNPMGTSIREQSHGLQSIDGRLWGGGPAYKVRFDAGGFEITPALGSTADRNHSLSFQLEDISRDGVALHSASSSALPSHRGRVVTYARGSQIEETYRIETDGMEQSFIFNSPLHGSGDLVVRGKIQGDLVTSHRVTSTGELRFEHGSLGGISVGEVVGIDATGMTQKGTLRFDGLFLELVLPGSFVDAATYPLVLDPPIGPFISIASGDDDRSPDAAYDPGQDLYLVVWERQFSSTDVDIRGQRVNTNGALVGGIVFIDTVAANLVGEPTVANIRASQRFLVAYEEDTTPTGIGISDIKARAVDASPSGGVSSIVTVANTSANEHSPDTSGEMSLTDDKAWIVWTEDGAGIKASQVIVPPSSDALPDPTVLAKKDISIDPGDLAPSITKSGGSDGVYVIVWQRFFSGGPGDHDLRTMVYDRNGTALTSEISLVSTVGRNEMAPDVDGDGVHFMIVYQEESTVNSGDFDVVAKIAEFQAGMIVNPLEFVIDADVGDNELAPAVGFTGESFIVSWSDEYSVTDYDMYVTSVDPFNAFLAEPPTLIDISLTMDMEPEIATEYAAQGSGDEALVVWESLDLGANDGDIKGQLYRTDSGTVTDLGGGCGTGGTSRATSAVVGNNTFTSRLDGAQPFSFAHLVLSFSTLNTSCGSCIIVPDLFTGFVFSPGATDASGDQELLIPIPASINVLGLTFFEQWAVETAVMSCPVFGVDLSNAIQVQIQ